MKRICVSSPSSSSTSSSSCIGPTLITHNNLELKNKPDVFTNKPKRVRAKKLPTNTSHNSVAVSPKLRSSIYRGVTRHRCTGRYEAHLWDKTTWNTIQSKRGRQIYLGAYDEEEEAARTYDLAALKYWGPSTIINFPVESYAKEIEEMEKVPKDEYLVSLRRRSSGFSRGVSKYRGVARHHHNGRWEARIGRVSGNKYLYLGTYSTQEEAAEAYDKAAIKYRGVNAITNFNINNYVHILNNIAVPDFEQKKEEPNPDEPKQQGVIDEPKSVMFESDPMPIMEPTQYPWDISLDSGFDPLPLTDVGWLDYKGFKDDDIACILDFDYHDHNNFSLEDAMSGTCRDSNDVAFKDKDLPTSHSSSSLSSVCSNI